MPIITKKWAERLLAARRVTPNLGLVRVTELRTDIEALADSLFRAGYGVHPDVANWIDRMDRTIESYKAV